MVQNGHDEQPIEFRYKFTFDNGREREFIVLLDAVTLEMQKPPREEYPPWTRLDNNQCSNCPLKKEDSPRCPTAESMVEVIDIFKDSISSDQVDIEISTPMRTYKKRASLSTGVSALIGLHMATSGCPVLGKMKPMARTHMPFATLPETLYRMMGMYMLGQFFKAKEGKKPDLEMKGLVEIIEDVRIVNKAFCQRLYEVCTQDASLNAVVHLDCFADNSSFIIQKKGLERVKGAFDHYLREDPK
jgi:hypothetical protein